MKFLKDLIWFLLWVGSIVTFFIGLNKGFDGEFLSATFFLVLSAILRIDANNMTEEDKLNEIIELLKNKKE